MEAYEGIMNSTRAPFSILPKPIDEDGNTVTTTGGADDDRYPLVPEEAMVVAAWQQLLNKAAAYPADRHGKACCRADTTRTRSRKCAWIW